MGPILLWQGGLLPLCVSGGQLAQAVGRATDLLSGAGASHLTLPPAFLLIVFTLSFCFLTFLGLPPEITFCSALVCVLLPGFGTSSILLACLALIQPHLWLDSMYPVHSALYLRDAVLFFSLINLLLLCHTLNQSLLDYLHIQRPETA